MKLDLDCLYNTDHEWIRVEGEEGVIGVSDYAQDQLSDVVYVELPEVGDTYEKNEVFATIESVKAASDVFLPVGGEVLEINEDLEDEPELINQDPYGKAWLARISIVDAAELDGLMDAQGYKDFIAGLEE